MLRSVPHTSFLVPGQVMMRVLQNAFANSSSSLIQSKVTGNLVFLLVTALSHRAWYAAYVGASMVRGLVVGTGVFAGLWAEKFDRLAAFQNFFIMPMTFLSGVFYSVKSLPGVWQAISHFNPFFYMIDGFRRGFFGHSDVSPWLSLSVVGTAFVVVAFTAQELLRRGYKLRA